MSVMNSPGSDITEPAQDLPSTLLGNVRDERTLLAGPRLTEYTSIFHWPC